MAKSKDEQQKELEEKRKLRKKQIAQLRASNEMLEEAKKTIMQHYGEDSDVANGLMNDVDMAKRQNLNIAESYLNATKHEVETEEYNTVNPKEVEMYEARLKLRGITDEEVRQKDISGIEKSDTSDKKAKESKMGMLLEKLKSLKKSNGRPKVNKVVDIEINERPVMNEESVSVVGDNGCDGLTDEESKTSVTRSSVVSIEDINPDLAYKRERLKDYIGFDPRSIPSYVQYDVIPLPSHGECYPSKQDTIAVAYLTASDENIITSPNLYNNGSLIDIILERKILDKNIHVSDLCNGDRDAILVWLRATAYGSEFPVVATYNNKQYQTNVDLSKLKYKEFNLKGDENGYFEYVTDEGDVLKFKILSHRDDEKLLDNARKMYNETNSNDIINYCNKILENVAMIDDEDSVSRETVAETVIGVRDWAENVSSTKGLTNEMVYNTTITNKMVANTVSVNGNTDQEYIKLYIENMRAKEAKKYREYIMDNTPGVDFNISVDIPESDGGGSFETFLQLRETLFINV